MRTKRQFEISVEANEVVIGPRRLQVRASAALEPETARGALGLEAGRGTVTLSNKGRTATLALDGELPAGPQTLVVGELVTARGRRLNERIEVPFFVSDSRAKVGGNLRVESIVRLQVDQRGTTRVSAARRPDGRYIEVMKAVD